MSRCETGRDTLARRARGCARSGVEEALGGFAEFGAEVGVGDGDELVGALADCLAQQPCDAVLGDDRVRWILANGRS